MEIIVFPLMEIKWDYYRWELLVGVYTTPEEATKAANQLNISTGKPIPVLSYSPDDAYKDEFLGVEHYAIYKVNLNAKPLNRP